MFDFSNQVVLVTGGSGNLGGAVVRAFHAAGAALVVPDRAADRVPALFPELAGGGHYLAPSVDVADAAALETLAAEAKRRYGRIDALVNCAGTYRGGLPAHETPLDVWQTLHDANAGTVFYACRAVIPVMLERGRGKIVNVGARSALAGGANESAYAASKSAVARLTESMAAEYKRAGINVNAVLPSAIVSAQDRAANPDAGVTPEELAQVIMFLCSDAAAIIHGVLLPVYGTRF